MSLESIYFQKTDFFDDLVLSVNKIRQLDKSLNNKLFFESKEFKDISYVIKKYTNLQVVFENDNQNACAYIPLINNNHVLFNNDDKKIIRDLDVNIEEGISDIINKLKENTVKGYVDFKHCKVDGVFKEFVNRIGINRKLFLDDPIYTDQEVSAIILHELGHIFTFFEYSSRLITTNQALSLTMKCIDKNISEDKKEIIFMSLTANKLSKDELESLVKTNNIETAAIIILGAKIRDCESELGVNLYDYTTAEYLADQFATRLGAGQYVVTGIDKLSRQYKILGRAINSVWYGGWTLYFIISSGVASIIPISIFYLLSLIINVLSNTKANKYDDDYNRYTRIRLQNTEALKNRDLTTEEKNFYLQQNEIIENVISNYNDNKGFIDTLSYWVKPGYRKAHDFEVLQKNLERLAGNKLFDKAAKLSTL